MGVGGESGLSVVYNKLRKNRNNYIKKGYEYIEEYVALNNYFGGYKW